MTVKQLRDALTAVASRYDDHEVLIWLPGSRIDITQFMGLHDNAILFEGNRWHGTRRED